MVFVSKENDSDVKSLKNLDVKCEVQMCLVLFANKKKKQKQKQNKTKQNMLSSTIGGHSKAFPGIQSQEIDFAHVSECPGFQVNSFRENDPQPGEV